MTRALLVACVLCLSVLLSGCGDSSEGDGAPVSFRDAPTSASVEAGGPGLAPKKATPTDEGTGSRPVEKPHSKPPGRGVPRQAPGEGPPPVAAHPATPREAPESDLPLTLPGPARRAQGMPKDLQALHAAAASSDMAAAWRAFADRAAATGFQAEAADAYRREAAIYRRTGDTNAAQVEELKAAQYATTLELYARRPALPWDGRQEAPRARLEPRLGCYVGAFIDRDDNIPWKMMESQIYGDVAAFGQRVGKVHASHFMYRAYGQPFPREWAEYLRNHGVIPHIAWEPRSLADVRDDGHLEDWVRQVRELDWPVFIRFAGEMNGDWTRYHGDPAAYKRAFRLVYRAFRKAPKAALIWCPNTIPENGLDAYYPGDDACDWVGVNFYSVLYLDNDRTRPGEKIHPTDLLDHVYQRYSARKPIAIGEYAATHVSKVDERSRPDFAVDKIAQLYGSLPTRYPRVKLVDWYDCNNLSHAMPGRQLNNYLLTDVPEIQQAYAHAIAHPWFLGADDVRRGSDARVVEAPLSRGGDGITAVRAWVRTYVAHPSVYFRVDGRIVHATRLPDRCEVPTSGLGRGRHTVEVLVYDDRGRFITSREGAFTL